MRSMSMNLTHWPFQEDSSTAFDVSFHLLEQLTTEGNCNHVKKLMGFLKD